MGKGIGIFMLIASLQSGSTALADEGLFLFESAPAVVQKARPSVFTLVTDKAEWLRRGTAFVVGRADKIQSTELYLVTALHNLPEACMGLGPCEELSVYQDALYKQVGLRTERVSATTRAHQLDVLDVSERTDLVLLRATFPQMDPSVQVLATVKSCSIREPRRAFTIGFPNVTLRQTVKIAIDKPMHITKRWSVGHVFAGLFEGATPISVDGLDGSSGGPIFTEDGEVLGVYRGITDPDAGFGYVEAQSPSALAEDHYGTAVSCQNLKDFLKSYWKTKRNQYR